MIQRMEEELRAGEQDKRFDPPFTTLQVTQIEGGTASNVVPVPCWFGWEVRALPGFDPMALDRRLKAFAADGPLPLASMFDNGFELSTGQFVVPRKLVLYARGSKVFGEFGSPYEYAGGLKWYLLPTERLWLTGEVMRVHHAPYSGAFTPYTAGMNGWVPMVQTVLAF